MRYYVYNTHQTEDILKAIQLKGLALAALAAILFAACASQPPPTKPQPVEPEGEKAPAVEKPTTVEKPAEPIPAPEQELARAKELKEMIIAAGLETFDQDAFSQAEKHMQDAEQKYGKDNAGAKESLLLAIPLYERILSKGMAKYRDEKLKLVQDAKAKADSVKANVAAAREYAKAASAQKQAETAFAAKQYKDAFGFYDEAIASYLASHDVAVEKRKKADQALKQASEQIKATEEFATEMEKEMEAQEGGAQ